MLQEDEGRVLTLLKEILHLEVSIISLLEKKEGYSWIEGTLQMP